MTNEEARMRQALGLRNGPSAGGQVPQRREAEQRGRRFVKDGEVPVVVVHSGSRELNGDPLPVNRIAAAESMARNERHARENAERALAEAQATVQHLRTQIAHTEMAHREALAAERATRELAEQALREAIEARTAAEARVTDLASANRIRRPRAEFVVAADHSASEFLSVDGEAAPRPRRGRPRKIVAATVVPATPQEEAEPVQWWLPSFRAGGRKR